MSDMSTKHEITSTGQFLNEIVRGKSIRPNAEKLLFRGHEQGCWKLRPKFARAVWPKHNGGGTADSLLKVQREMIDEFKESAKHSLPGSNGWSELEWLAVARHHGLPTCLLDWTANPLIGLWFAVRKAHDTKKCGRPIVWVWKFDPKLLIRASDVPVLSKPRLAVFEATIAEPRIKSQAAWFSFDPMTKFDPDDKSPEPLDHYFPECNGLYPFTIDCKPVQIRDELEDLGITAQAVFPDLSGLCESIAIKRISGIWQA